MVNDKLKEILKPAFNQAKRDFEVLVKKTEQQFVEEKKREAIMQFVQQQYASVITHNILNGSFSLPPEVQKVLDSTEDRWKEEYAKRIETFEAMKELFQEEEKEEEKVSDEKK